MDRLKELTASVQKIVDWTKHTLPEEGQRQYEEMADATLQRATKSLELSAESHHSPSM